jgi:hypothetical protein
MILGTFGLSVFSILIISYIILLLLAKEFIALINAVLLLSETLGKEINIGYRYIIYHMSIYK